TLAQQDYNKAIELDPNDPHFYTNRGTSYLRIHQYAQALADYSKAIELESEVFPMDDTDKGMLYAGRGFIDLRMGKLDEAINDLKTAINLNFQAADIYNNGSSRDRVGQFEAF
ncbi:MAG: tetratricopeptide repeat protein, partial [Nitrospirales bacterium]